MIHIDVKHGFRIGDALSHVPYVNALCAEHSTGAFVTGFNHAASRLISPSSGLVFCAPTEAVSHVETMDTQVAFGLNNQFHMAQAFFHLGRKAIPELPIVFPMQECKLFIESGIVVAPFSRSDINHNKVWSDDKWIETVLIIQRKTGIRRAYVLGAGLDNKGSYLKANITALFNRSLRQVLYVLRRASLVLTIDNGISHLCHYGNVARHVLLYPGCLPACWVDNPNAIKVRGACPADVTTGQMIDAALEMWDCYNGA